MQQADASGELIGSAFVDGTIVRPSTRQRKERGKTPSDFSSVEWL